MVGKKAGTQLDEALLALDQSGLRRTQPRVTLLRLLIEEHGPFSVDEILARPAGRDLDRVTAYRCLTALEEIGLGRRCEFGDGASRYEFGGGEDHHHHIVCRRCHRAESIDKCVPRALIKAVKAMGYENITHSLEFFGICRKCR